MKLKNRRIHIIGIGGISLSAIAKLLLKENYISGSDLVKSDLTTELESLGIKVFYDHKFENVNGVDLVVMSAAISEDNPEVQEAKKRKIPILTRAEVLGKISKKYKNVITVSGSHGKTTTTGMIAECFLRANKNPTIHIGGKLKSIDGNLKVSGSEYFITEACEYVDSFLHFSPNSTVALNIEPDHMDYFKNFNNLKKSFEKYLKNTKKLGFNIINADDKTLLNINHKKRCITYGIENFNADVQAKNLRRNKFSMYSFDIVVFNKKVERIKLNVPGKHEIYNALACVCVCMQYKIGIQDIKFALENYSGIKRRFENMGSINGAKVIHDYAHHPTEIKAVMDCVRHGKGRVIVIFQPHTYSRTKELWNEFVDVLSIADIIFVYEIYPARESQIEGITSQNLSTAICKIGGCSIAFDNYQKMYETLKAKVNHDDVVLILGAGDIVGFCDYVKNQV